MIAGNHRMVPAKALPESAVIQHSQPASMLDLEFAQLSDRGRIREDNEDLKQRR